MRIAPKVRWFFGAVGVGSLLMGAGCDPGEDEVDKDGDGFLVSEGDCNDFDPLVNPGAIDVCDQQDNNCDFRTDEVDDKDQDGASACNGGDCDDLNPAVRPGAPEIVDNLDNDCNCVRDPLIGDTNGDGLVCGPGDAGVDDDPRLEDLDGDGFCEGLGNPLECFDPGDQPGDCNELSPLVSPGSIEVVDNVDNNCDGNVDEPPVSCDTGLNAQDPFSFAKAMGLGCSGEVDEALFVGPSNPQARAIVQSYGSGGLSFPFEGDNFVIFSSGPATSTNDHSGFGGGLGNSFAHPSPNRPCDDDIDNDGDNLADHNGSPAPNNLLPDPQCVAVGFVPAERDFSEGPEATCEVGDQLTVNDYTEYRITVTPPSNATGFSYRLQFLSGEYPGFHCSEFDDTFFAFLDSQGFSGNISFDASGRVISINSGFFQICDEDDQGNVCTQPTQPELGGTGFQGNGGTKALVTTVPSIPQGQQFQLRFVIFDEGDDVLDSSILLDGWQWIGIPCEDDPNTGENECDPSTKIP